MSKRQKQAFEEYKRLTELEDGCAETDLLAVDLRGNLHRQTIPTDRILEKGPQFRILCDTDSLGEYPPETPAELVLVPDWGTAFRDPFGKRPTAVFCKIIDPTVRGGRWLHDSRDIARKAERYLRLSHIATESRWGMELQFFVKKKHGEGEKPLDSQRLRAIRTRITATLAELGIKVVRHREVGEGLCEFVLGHEPLLAACDKLVLAKYVIGRISDRASATAVFLPTVPAVPESKDRAEMRVHFSLWHGDTPLFYDAASPSGFSPLTSRVMGGILLHDSALDILCAPNFFANQGRLTMRIIAMRNPHDLGDKDARRVAVRFPDPSANPYLAFAALLLASVKNKWEWPEATKLPLRNWHGWVPIGSAPQADKVAQHVDEVLDRLVTLGEFLTASGVFDSRTLQAFANLYRNSDSPKKPSP